MTPGNLTTEEFKERIRKLLGIQQGEGKRSNRNLVRKAGDRGYYKTKTTKGKQR
jgi:hypothetical protein